MDFENPRSGKPVRSRRTGGFTLVELLVAISVLAIVAVLGWRGLDGIVRARIALTNSLEQTRGMQLTFAQMQSDGAHLASAASIPKRAPLVVEPDRILMVRTVFAEDQPMRLQVVAYQLRDGVLTRRESAATRDLNTLGLLWTAATSNADTTQAVALQSGVAAMTTRVWITNGAGWISPGAALQQAADPNTPATPSILNPIGLEVSLKLQNGDLSMTKVFLLGPV